MLRSILISVLRIFYCKVLLKSYFHLNDYLGILVLEYETINISVYLYTHSVVMLGLTTTDIPNITISVWNTAIDICDHVMLAAIPGFVIILGGGPLPITT